jgi:sugar/nucleoside kinase (ribokinase family)
MKKFSDVQVVGLGTCNIDFLMKVPHFSAADDEVDIEKLAMSLGGSAANFTATISRLGVKSGIITRVGNDQFGQFAQRELKKEGVETQRLLKIEEPTGMTFIAVDQTGERSMYNSMGANAKLELEKEDIQYIKDSHLLHLTGMYIEVVEEASKHAHVLSFSPGTILSGYGMDALEKIIKKAHMLFLNKKEVKILTGMDFKEGAQMLVDKGVPMVVVTCGCEGANLYTEEGVIHAPSREVNCLDTTGAGDTFAAGFIASFIKGKNLFKCLESGNVVASSCVQKFGAVDTHKINDEAF